MNHEIFTARLTARREAVAATAATARSALNQSKSERARRAAALTQQAARKSEIAE